MKSSVDVNTVLLQSYQICDVRNICPILAKAGSVAGSDDDLVLSVYYHVLRSMLHTWTNMELS